ncbi:DUF6019 family protein [Raoultibacter phocaeensis]|uniref:DUF6019 family protein n=1 Tax=Raoultibacter phocaeensis TaxID=2479841 RepID=UPI00111A0CD3|nr:DUF6019 family protein [Raoultibacter phocaeensis]
MKLMGMGIPEMLFAVFYVLFILLFVFLLYWIVKKAVKNGILEARRAIKEEESTCPQNPNERI